MNINFKNIFLQRTGKLTDKWSLYLNVYDKILLPYQDQEINILEIGIQNGGSLELWQEYLPNAKNIIGCDNDPKCECLEYDDERISVIIGNANSDKIEQHILSKSDNFDIIIDDGSHQSSDVIQSFARYFPYLNDNGIYIIEDIHTSFWKDHGGGLFNPYSTISFLKRLVDIINYEHWRLCGVNRTSILKEFEAQYQVDFSDDLLNRIHSINFFNSICAINIKTPDNNVLGKRIIRGTNECVTTGFFLKNDTQIHDLSPIIEDDHHFDVFTLLENKVELKQKIIRLDTDMAERDGTIQTLTADLAEREQTIQSLTADLAERENEVLFYATSKSWRITRPLRKAVNLAKRIFR